MLATLREGEAVIKKGIKQPLLGSRYSLNKLLCDQVRKEYQIDVADIVQ